MWPRKPPTRDEKSIVNELHELRKRQWQVQGELRDAQAWRVRTALAEFFAQHKDKAPELEVGMTSSWAKQPSGKAVVETSSGVKIEVDVHFHTQGWRRQVPNQLKLSIRVPGFESPIQSSATLTDAQAQSAAKLGESVIAELYPKMFARTVKRYTRLHQKEWAKIKY
jgi:hypothetical protein